MSTPPPEQALLTRDHRRRRWLIRLSLLLLFLALFVTLAGLLLLSPSGMTAEEAMAAYQQLKPHETREQAERLLGKPYSENTENGVTTLSWQYYTHGLTTIDVFYCVVHCDQRGKVLPNNSMKVKVEGWEAWRWRWNKLKQRLGIRL